MKTITNSNIILTCSRMSQKDAIERVGFRHILHCDSCLENMKSAVGDVIVTTQAQRGGHIDNDAHILGVCFD